MDVPLQTVVLTGCLSLSRHGVAAAALHTAANTTKTLHVMDALTMHTHDPDPTELIRPI